MKSKLKILVAAEDTAGVRILQALVNAGHNIIGVLATPDDKAITSIWRFAVDSGIRIWHAKNVKDPSFAETVRQLRADLLLSIRFPYIINKLVLAAPAIGSYNLHTGPLPKYAGLHAVSWAIYNGEKRHAITLHEMVDNIDAGAIVGQAVFDIERLDTGLTVTRKCIKHAVPLVLKLVEMASRGKDSIPSIKQDQKFRHYYGKEIPQGGCIDWKLSARQVVNFVRACDFYPFASPWASPQCTLGNKQLSVCKARLTSVHCNEKPGTIRIVGSARVEVATRDEWVLIELLKYDDNYLAPHKVLINGGRLYSGKSGHQINSNFQPTNELFM